MFSTKRDEVNVKRDEPTEDVLGTEPVESELEKLRGEEIPEQLQGYVAGETNVEDDD